MMENKFGSLESEKSPEGFEITPEMKEMIEIFNKNEFDSLESREAFGKFTDEAYETADKISKLWLGDKFVSNNSNIAVAIKLGLVCLNADDRRYKDRGMNALEDAYEMALNSKDAEDLIEEIEKLGEEYTKKFYSEE